MTKSSWPWPGAVWTSPVPALPVAARSRASFTSSSVSASASPPSVTWSPSIRRLGPLLPTRQELWVNILKRASDVAFLNDLIDQLTRDDVDLAVSLVLHRRVIEVRVDGDAEVGRERPGRRRPDEEVDLARVVLVAEQLALEGLRLERVLGEREL